MNIKYVHTNIIAKDWKKLSQFYQEVFNCKPVPPERNLEGEWVDKLTGLPNAHITGVHLALPGYEDFLPTLEIFSYDRMEEYNLKRINGIGYGHLAFQTDDVEGLLKKLLHAGGKKIGELVKTVYPGKGTAVFLYAADPEGNIIELQSWEK
ncbi:VOC family protein [Anaerocolumna sp. AGMB13025]|uniref:VOC family protein n=1 Tax=Anaerocolumna sp. AGMB13025 TaxID=3039116 RepID=UPI00241FD3E8|nr:VOC family protein [Anaerocolumna sp. AGMB13025]WFR56932.1 VOC family protein [Anaerocolumna sp. AGMB13025]